MKMNLILNQSSNNELSFASTAVINAIGKAENTNIQ
jgi:hypothetical protein